MTQQSETNVINAKVIQLTENAVKETDVLKLQALAAVINGGDQDNFAVNEVNPRLFEVTKCGNADVIGTQFLVATAEEYEHIRHTMVFDQLSEMDIDLLMEYAFQDMAPEELKPLILGILMAPEDTISAYTKNRSLSMLLNFESMLRDFAEDECDEVSGVFRVKFEMLDDSELPANDFVVVDTSVTAEEKEAIEDMNAEKESSETEQKH